MFLYISYLLLLIFSPCSIDRPLVLDYTNMYIASCGGHTQTVWVVTLSYNIVCRVRRWREGGNEESVLIHIKLMSLI